jgi:hypothetical protein
VPFSAMALVAGAITLLLGTLLLPTGDGGAAATLRVVQEEDQRAITVAVMFCASSVGLLMGIPSLLVLFPRKGRRIGIAAVAMMVVAGAGLAGFGMLLAFFRALAIEDAVVPATFEKAASESGFQAMLLVWVASFYLFELLLAIAVLRARTVPVWIPVLLVLHAALFFVADYLPDGVSRWLILLTAIGLSGLAVAANQEADRDAGVGPLVLGRR